MDNKYQVVALVGRSGVGKDYLIRATCERHPTIFNKIISCTTRPCRETELENPPYTFLSLENFTRKVLAGNMLEATEFNNWFYGTLKTALVPDKINIGVFSPGALKQLQTNEDLNVLVVKIDAMDKTCLLRALNREECPDCEEICRRFLADTKDLAQIKEDTLISNEDDTDSDLLQNARVSLHIEDLWNEIHPETFFAEAIKADEVLKDNMN